MQVERNEGLMDFCMPENGAVMRFVFNEERVVKILGRLADKRARWEGAPVAGLLVTGDFDDKLVAPDELEKFSQLSTTIIAQRLHVPFHSHFARLQAFVGKLFAVEVVTDGTSVGPPSIVLPGQVQKNSLKVCSFWCFVSCLDLWKPKTNFVAQMQVMDEIMLTHSYPPGSVLIEWRASPSADCVADAVVSFCCYRVD